MIFDLFLSALAIAFGSGCLFAKPSMWRLLASVIPTVKADQPIPREWRINLNLLGGVSLFLGVMLLLAAFG